MAQQQQHRGPPRVLVGRQTPTAVALLAISLCLGLRPSVGFVHHGGVHVKRAPIPSTSWPLSTSRRLNHRLTSEDGGPIACSAFRASDRPCRGNSGGARVPFLNNAAADGDAAGDSGGSSVVDGATPPSVASSPSSLAAVQPRRRGRPRKVEAAPDDSITAVATKPTRKKRVSQTVVASSSVVVEKDNTALGTSRGAAENAIGRPRRGRPRLPSTLKKNGALLPGPVGGARLTPGEARKLVDAQASYEAARQAAVLRRAEIIAAAEAAAKLAEEQRRTRHPAALTETPPPSWSSQQEDPPSTATTTTSPAAVVGSDFEGRVADIASGPASGVAYARAAGLRAIGLSGVNFNGTNDEWRASYDLPARNPVVEELPAPAAVDVADGDDGDLEDEAAAKRPQIAEIEFQDDVEMLDGDAVEGQADESRILGANDTAILVAEASELAVNATALAEEEAEQDRQQAAIQRQGLKVGAFGKERLVYHGDYCVHEDYGFCRYLANEFLEEGEGDPNEITLEFRDDQISIDRADAQLLTRYRAADAARVPLSMIADSDAWQRHKAKVAERVAKQAVNVMDLYRKRARIEREPCRPDGPEMDEFVKGFKHQPTADQLRCLSEIESDMVWRKVPMDRLLCGDVGFGKTEVALRAMFRAVQNNRQVALLAPTTILAAQHYRTLQSRMPNYVNVALLRAGNSLGSREIKIAIKNQTLDIVVGTHSLLSRKVEFPNLGLLVIDEEQKFGVNQKEKLKVLTTGVDVLTLTATPIPRTLHMSLTGIRDLSTIFSPPSGRQNVTTYVMRGTDDIVKHALARELKRGGQVFYVVPRIGQVEEAREQIVRCAPEAKISIGHSKVKGLEDVVLQFTLGNGDVLLATSIIENGIDMPNVNSIVVMDAHMFGLSQLYQLRGRVGRSDVAAFTYLLYPPGHNLSNEAKRRLKAMRELSHLGSGFELANRDLEIRGAGNIFGTDQSGDLKDIGYELYMNMLEEAIVSVRGTNIQPVLRCNVDMGFGKELDGSVPEDYMTCEPEQRARQIDRLRVCNSFRELVRIAKEWVAEYGPMPVPVRRLFKRTHLNTACRLLGVSDVALEYLPIKDRDAVDGEYAMTGLRTGAGREAEEDRHQRLQREFANQFSEVQGLQARPSSHAPDPVGEVDGKDANPGVVLGGGGWGRGVGGSINGAVLSSGTPSAERNHKNNNGVSGKLGVEGVPVGSSLEGGEGRGGQGNVLSPGVGTKARDKAEGVPEGGDNDHLVPFAVLSGPEVTRERWEILFRQGPLNMEQLENVAFREDAGGVALRGVEGEEEAWLSGDREQWLDHVLALLLPLVEYVEAKQHQHMKGGAVPRTFIC